MITFSQTTILNRPIKLTKRGSIALNTVNGKGRRVTDAQRPVDHLDELHLTRTRNVLDLSMSRTRAVEFKHLHRTLSGHTQARAGSLSYQTGAEPTATLCVGDLERLGHVTIESPGRCQSDVFLFA